MPDGVLYNALIQDLPDGSTVLGVHLRPRGVLCATMGRSNGHDGLHNAMDI